MTLQTRILVLVTVLLVTAVIATSATLSWNAQRSILTQTGASAESIAKVLAYSAAFAEELPDEVERLVGEQMVVQATIAAHFVSTAERLGLVPAEINRELRRIVENTDLAEIWITDEAGHAYLSSVPGVDFTFDPDPAIQPQAHVFHALLTGDAKRVIQEARVREIDDEMMKYVGVPGIDHPRIVQVGYEFGYIEELRDRLGLNHLLEDLLEGGGIDAIWVLSDGLRTLAFSAAPGLDVGDGPDGDERALIARALREGRSQSMFSGDVLKVAAPIAEHGEPVAGAALVYFPLDVLNATLMRDRLLSVLVAAIVLALGILASVMVGRRLTGPVMRVSEAAAAFEAQRFAPAALAEVCGRGDELGNLARVFTRMAGEVQARTDILDRLVGERTAELNLKNLALEQSLAQIAEELAMAQRMQLSILPKELPARPDVELYARMTAAREVGGDFYDAIEVDDDHIAIVIADVSGKGVPAALFMAVSCTVIKSVAARGGPPGEALAIVNDILCEGNDAAMFVTVFYGVLNSRTGRLTYVNAGHNPPYLIRRAGGLEPLATTEGMALGVMNGLAYAERTLDLAVGDTVFCYTDGITEAFDAAGTEFTETRLERALYDAHGVSVELVGSGVIDRVQRFAGDAPQSDDITCMVIRYHGGVS